MSEIKPIINALLRSKTGAVLLLIQIAITTAIVSNAAFIIHDRLVYLDQETGYPEQDIFSFKVMTYGENRDLSQQFEEDETRLRNIPGIIDAAITNSIPLSGSGWASDLGVNPEPEAGKKVRAAIMTGDDHTLQTLGISVSEGRNFYPDEVVVTQDRQKKSAVAIVSKTLLNEIFPEGAGLGNTIYLGGSPLKIVGVVDKMKTPFLKDSRPDNLLITPYIEAASFQNVMVRVQPGQRADVMNKVETILLDAWDKRVITGISGLDETKQHYNASDTLMIRMLIVLIVVLVAVTALGIFGLTLFNISKRTRQIGTRRALGARKSDIICYFLIENSLICLAGLSTGAVLAVVLGQQLLARFSLTALDNTYIAFTALVVMIMTLLAVIGPARRAAKIPPSVATRSV